MKIRTKLGILPITLAIIMLTVSLLITIIISNNTIKNQIGNHLLSTAQSRAHNIETLLNDYKETVHVLAVGMPFTNVFDPQIDYTKRINECNLRIKRTIESNPDISIIKVLNRNGIVISSSNEDIGSNLSESVIFTKGKENIYIADIHKSEHTGNLILSISAPIFLREIFSGVVIINFNLEKKLFKILTDRTGLGKTGEIYLVNKDGYLLSPSRFIDVTILKTKIDTKQVKLFMSEHIVKGFPENREQKLTDYLDYRGKKVFGIHYFISEMQWGLIAEFDVKEVYKPINKQAILLITIFSVLLLAVLFFVFKLSRDITLPLVKLHEGTKEIIKGNLDHKVGIESKDEIGELSHSFDIMTGRLKKAKKEVESHTEDLETTVKKRTAELKKQFEKSEKQRIATLVIMNDLNAITKELKAEITERKKAEKELAKHRDNLEELVEERTKELENANKELEAFSYSVSHDLRAPLRSIDGFSHILLEDYSDVLDEQAKNYLNRVRASTQNMAQLINDLLNLSRIGRKSLNKKSLNFKTIADEVFKTLEDDLKNRKVNFIVHKCPTVFADPDLMQIVLTNLIYNAFKFTRNRKIAEIEFGYEEKDNKTIFFVKDNGAGFDMKYADKLFSPFQRLHSAEEYEGTGIGLAIVHRVINKHGGNIWAESEPDKGTTVYFTI